MPDKQKIAEEILKETTGHPLQVQNTRSLAGGCINDAFKADTNGGAYFIKLNEPDKQHMFEVEAKGLRLLYEANELRIPEVYGYGSYGHHAYIVMEYLEAGPKQQNYWEDFGKSLARLHKHSNEKFGLDHQNYIGSLPQYNDFRDNWIDFFIEQRLEIQLKWAVDNGKLGKETHRKFEALCSKLPNLLPDEKPALLHGDLWIGNVSTGPDGYVALIDPAVYYGHREIELAFTDMFGGFSPGFYESYHEEFPLEKGFDDRIDLYNLYPLLVHVNLFGGGYAQSVQRILQRIV